MLIYVDKEDAETIMKLAESGFYGYFEYLVIQKMAKSLKAQMGKE